MQDEVRGGRLDGEAVQAVLKAAGHRPRRRAGLPSGLTAREAEVLVDGFGEVFPPLLVYLAASGEAAGRLDEMLERAADYLEREFDRFTATALSLLEPLIIVLMGGVVATIVLSILLPILQLETLAGQ